MPRVPKPKASAKSVRKPVKRVNPARKKREWERAYGSKARVEWVKAQPCAYCVGLSPFFGKTDSSSHNAHTEHDGGSRKGGYKSIVPLCPTHHSRFDLRQYPFDDSRVRAALRTLAATTERYWQLSQASNRTHPNGRGAPKRPAVVRGATPEGDQ